ncbi:hypothetical protein MPSEU_000296600 [Mayamaea pseudoterrestris]|nr:hypothetical protein MPSEU_000296600 [Mayamaea pseudoterrestris]
MAESIHETQVPSADTVLEGYLFKQGSRSRQFWHERYFTFSADGTLRYYTHNPKQDFYSISNRTNSSSERTLEPKGVIDIPQLPDCNVSDLYVAKHQKQLMYCIKLTWSADTQTESSVGSYLHDDNFSQASDVNHGSAPNSPMQRSLSDRKVASPEELRAQLQKQSSSSSLTPKVLRKKLKTPFQRLKHRSTTSTKHVANGNMNQTNGAVDRNDGRATPSYGMHHRWTKSDAQLMRRIMLSPLEEEDETLHSAARSEIPATVEWLEGGDAEHDENDTNTILLKAMHPPPEHTLNTSPPSSPTLSRLQLQRNASAASAAKEEQEYLQHQYETNRKAARRRNRKLMVQSGQYAAAAGAAISLTILTAGAGLIVGLALLGATAVAGGGAAGVGTAWKKKVTGEIVVAGPDYDIMCRWKAYLDASRESAEIKQSRWGQLFVSDGRTPALLPQVLEVPYFGKVNSMEERVARFEQGSCWRPVEGGWSSLLGTGAGLRMFREECGARFNPDSAWQLSSLFATNDHPACPPLKAHLVLHTSPLDAFLCLMSYNRMTEESSRKLMPNSEQVSSFQLVHSIDEHSDIIHVVFRPMYLFPSWTMPRDYCMFRYWRLEQDGSYIICYESMQHPSCPPSPGYVRGEMHKVVTIAPQKKSYRRKLGNNAPTECFMTTVAQVDPRGWIPSTPIPCFSHQTYAEAFGVATLSQMVDIRDAIDQDRFLPINVDDADRATHAQSYKDHDMPPAIMRNRSLDSNNADETIIEECDYDFSFCQHESLAGCMGSRGDSFFMNHPPCTPIEKWAEPDPNSFRVRGPNYLKDRNKINAGPSIGRLICADVVTVDEPIYTGMSVHPTERIQLALQEERKLSHLNIPNSNSPMPPFVFVVNIVLPGPPFYHGVFYYAIDDMSQIDGTNRTPSSKLCNEFFFGESDDFRDQTFKMIPQIVNGSFLVKKAVGSTPAIMGKKLRQLYVRDKNRRFMEVILDCGSSQVATGVIRLSLGYAASLVVDMGFLFEANDTSTLPERLFGAVRMKHPEFSPNLRRVEPIVKGGATLANEIICD